MIIYPVCFILSVIFAYGARRTKKRGLFIFLSIISIMIPVTLAGLRSITIGIDTQNYYNLPYYWRGAIRLPTFIEYMRYYLARSNGSTEILFASLVGIVGQISKNYSVLLFLVHLIIIGGVYIGAFRLKEHADPEFTLLLFYFLYYNHTLNISRQYIAVAIIFAAMADIQKRKFIRYLIFVFIAFFFHNTAVIGLVPMFLYMAIYPSNPLRSAVSWRKVLTLVVIIGGVVSFVPVVRLLIDQGVISSKYLYYINSDDTSVYTLVILFLFVEILGLFLSWPLVNRNDNQASYFLFCSISFILLYLLASTIKYGKRIAVYFAFQNMVTLGMMYKYQDRSFNRWFIKLAVAAAVVAYWGYIYAYRNASQTIPYMLGV